MPDTASAYEVEEIEVGQVNRQIVPAVRMPRETFVGLVRTLLDEGGYRRDGDLHAFRETGIADKLLPVAQTMPVFPLGAWIAPGRGCGCVVGEYLVASNLIDRTEAAEYFVPADTIEELLREDPDGYALTRFGGQIDASVRDHLYVRGTTRTGGSGPLAVVIED
jgi:hypothetical protein